MRCRDSRSEKKKAVNDMHKKVQYTFFPSYLCESMCLHTVLSSLPCFPTSCHSAILHLVTFLMICCCYCCCCCFGFVFYSGSVSAKPSILLMSVFIPMTLRGVGIIDSAALHELSLTQASVQALSQHFWMDVSQSKSINDCRGPN